MKGKVLVSIIVMANLLTVFTYSLNIISVTSNDPMNLHISLDSNGKPDYCLVWQRYFERNLYSESNFTIDAGLLCSTNGKDIEVVDATTGKTKSLLKDKREDNTELAYIYQNNDKLYQGWYRGGLASYDLSTGKRIDFPCGNFDGEFSFVNDKLFYIDNNKYCCYNTDGTRVWEKEYYINMISVAQMHGLIYISSVEHGCTCLDGADGKQLWEVKCGTDENMTVHLAVDENNVYLSGTKGYQNILTCLDRLTGANKYSVLIPGAEIFVWTPFEDKLIGGSEEGNLICVSATNGNIMWQTNIGFAIRFNPQVIDEKIFLTVGQTIFSFDLDGKLVDKINVGVITRGNLFYDSGRFYVGIEGSGIVSFGKPAIISAFPRKLNFGMADNSIKRSVTICNNASVDVDISISVVGPVSISDTTAKAGKNSSRTIDITPDFSKAVPGLNIASVKVTGKNINQTIEVKFIFSIKDSNWSCSTNHFQNSMQVKSPILNELWSIQDGYGMFYRNGYFITRSNGLMKFLDPQTGKTLFEQPYLEYEGYFWSNTSHYYTMTNYEVICYRYDSFSRDWTKGLGHYNVTDVLVTDYYVAVLYSNGNLTVYDADDGHIIEEFNGQGSSTMKDSGGQPVERIQYQKYWLDSSGDYLLSSLPKLTVVNTKTWQVVSNFPSVNTTARFFGNNPAICTMMDFKTHDPIYSVFGITKNETLFTFTANDWINDDNGRTYFVENKKLTCVDNKSFKKLWVCQTEMPAYTKFSIVGKYLYASGDNFHTVDMDTGIAQMTLIDSKEIQCVGNGKIIIYDNRSYHCYESVSGIMSGSKCLDFGSNLGKLNLAITNYTGRQSDFFIKPDSGLISIDKAKFNLSKDGQTVVNVTLNRSKLKPGKNVFKLGIATDSDELQLKVFAWVDDGKPVWLRNQDRTPTSSNINPEKLGLLWKTQCKQVNLPEHYYDNNDYSSRSTVIANGKLIYSLSHTIYAFDIETGKELWYREFKEETERTNIFFRWHDGLLYVMVDRKTFVLDDQDGSYVYEQVTPINTIVGDLNIDGGQCYSLHDFRKLWSINSKNSVYFRCFGDGLGWYFDENTVFCVDLSTGRQKWMLKPKKPYNNSNYMDCQLSYSAGVLVVATKGGDYGNRPNVTAYDAKTSKAIWELNTEGELQFGANGFFCFRTTEMREIMSPPDSGQYNDPASTYYYLDAWTGKRLNALIVGDHVSQMIAREKVYYLENMGMSCVSLKDPNYISRMADVGEGEICCAGSKVFVIGNEQVSCYDSSNGIHLDKTFIEGGQCLPGKSTTIALKIDNLGSSVLKLSASSGNEMAKLDQTLFTLNPGQISTLNVTFNFSSLGAGAEKLVAGNINLNWDGHSNAIPYSCQATPNPKMVIPCDRIVPGKTDQISDCLITPGRYKEAFMIPKGILQKDKIVSIYKNKITHISYKGYKEIKTVSFNFNNSDRFFSDKSGNLLVLSSESMQVQKIDVNTGKLMWNYSMQAPKTENETKKGIDDLFVRNDRAYITKSNIIECLDITNGMKLWRYECEYEGTNISYFHWENQVQSVYVKDGKVYVGFVQNVMYGYYKVICIDLITGKKTWSVSFGEKPESRDSLSRPMPSTTFYVNIEGMLGGKLFVKFSSSFVWSSSYQLVCLDGTNGKQLYSLPYSFNTDDLFENGLLKLKLNPDCSDAFYANPETGEKLAVVTGRIGNSKVSNFSVFSDSKMYWLADTRTGKRISQRLTEHAYLVHAQDGNFILGCYGGSIIADRVDLHVYTTAAKKLEFVIGSSLMKTDGISSNMGVKPELIGGKVYLPAKFVTDPLEISTSYESNDKSLKLSSDGKGCIFKVGSNKYSIFSYNYRQPIDQGYIDPTDLKVMPVVRNGRMLLPMRKMCELLGLTVAYDSKTKTVTVDGRLFK